MCTVGRLQFCEIVAQHWFDAVKVCGVNVAKSVWFFNLICFVTISNVLRIFIVILLFFFWLLLVAMTNHLSS